MTTDSTGTRSKGIFSATRVCRRSMAIAMAFGASAAANAAQVYTHHVREAVDSHVAQQISRLATDKLMSLDVVLPIRDEAGLDTFVAEVTDPSNANYQHYLTPQEFTARFGPTQNDYDTVVQYLTRYGFTVTGG